MGAPCVRAPMELYWPEPCGPPIGFLDARQQVDAPCGPTTGITIGTASVAENRPLPGLDYPAVVYRRAARLSCRHHVGGRPGNDAAFVLQLLLPVGHDLLTSLQSALEDHVCTLGAVDHHRHDLDGVAHRRSACAPAALSTRAVLCRLACAVGSFANWTAAFCDGTGIAAAGCTRARGTVRRRLPRWASPGPACDRSRRRMSRCFPSEWRLPEPPASRPGPRGSGGCSRTGLGRARYLRLTKTAFSLAVPVVVSIWLSTVSRLPVASFAVFARSHASATRLDDHHACG